MLDHIECRPITADGALMECLSICGSESNIVLGASGVEADNDVDYFGAKRIGIGYSLAFFLISFRRSALFTLRRKN